jgi:hypothetical protein
MAAVRHVVLPPGLTLVRCDGTETTDTQPDLEAEVHALIQLGRDIAAAAVETYAAGLPTAPRQRTPQGWAALHEGRIQLAHAARVARGEHEPNEGER